MCQGFFAYFLRGGKPVCWVKMRPGVTALRTADSVLFLRRALV
jgi:hypothetical protein